MADITKRGTTAANGSLQDGPSLGTMIPPWNAQIGALLMGEDGAPGDMCTIKSDGKLWKAKANINAAPAAPTVAGNGAGSSFGAGTYAVQVTYLTAEGESDPSPATMVTVTAAQNLRVSAIGGGALDASITGANFYVNGVWAATTAAAALSIAQTDIVGAALATGKVPPNANSAFKDKLYKWKGLLSMLAYSGKAGTLLHGLDIAYAASGLTPGADIFLSATAGKLADAAVYTGQKPCGYVVNATTVHIYNNRDA